MKKKVFIQLNIWWNLFLLVQLSLPVGMCAGFIVEMKKAGEFMLSWLIFVCVSCAILAIIILSTDSHHIKFDEEKCFSPTDLRLRNEKLQYKTVVYYDEIADIKLILSRHNSLDKPIGTFSMFSALQKRYFEITCKDGSRKRIFAMYFSKRQKIKIINEFKKRMASVGNDVVLPSAEELVAKQGKIGFEI